MKLFFSLAILLSLCACVGGGGGDSKGGSGGSGGGDGATLSATDLVERITLSDHVTGCYDNGDGGFNKNSLTAGSGAVYLTIDIYSDSACSTKLVSLYVDMTFTMGSAVAGLTNGYEVDYSIDSGTATINNGASAILNALNGGAGFCGKATWADGDSVIDILGTANCPVNYSNAEQVFDIIQYDTINNRVKFGDKSGANDGTTTGKRPSALETLIYNKI